jgi:hypothetical protein
MLVAAALRFRHSVNLIPCLKAEFDLGCCANGNYKLPAFSFNNPVDNEYVSEISM